MFWDVDLHAEYDGDVRFWPKYVILSKNAKTHVFWLKILSRSLSKIILCEILIFFAFWELETSV